MVLRRGFEPLHSGLEGLTLFQQTKHGGRSADESTRTHGGDKGERSPTLTLTGLRADHYTMPPNKEVYLRDRLAGIETGIV